MRVRIGVSTLTQQAPRAVAHLGGALHGPRRPELSPQFPCLAFLTFRFALPTPPPQRVCERGRQSFTSSRENSRHGKNLKWGRRGPNPNGMKGQEEGKRAGAKTSGQEKSKGAEG